MPAGFRFIEQYQNMAKELVHEAGDKMSMFDQEVPQSRYYSQEGDVKQHIKLEDVETQPDLFSMMESIISNDSTSSSSLSEGTNSNNYSTFYSNSNQRNDFFSRDNEIKLAPTSISSTSSSFFSSSPSPMMSSATNLTSSACSSVSTVFRSNPILSSRASSFFTDCGESDYNLVPSTDFLTDNVSIKSGGSVPEDSLEYIDLDKQQMSLYDDCSSVSDISKTGAFADESRRLEEAVIFMRDTIYNDCDNLKIPYNPMMWTPEHVRKWVSWVCHRNSVPDVSPHLHHIDGSTLCAMNQDTFSVFYGDTGVKLCNELELWIAANSCFPNQFCNTNNNNLTNVDSQHLHNPFMESHHSFSLPPCTSPALSSCSSTHDSNTSTNSNYSDHSDDESVSRLPHNSTSVSFGAPVHYNKILTKIQTGRGHKQTIHLWQFLKELLLSKDSNYSDCIRWLDRKAGVFKIEDSKKVASLWGARKNRPAMNYDKLSRSVRQYYKKGIIKKTEQSKRLVYQFCAGYL